MITGAERMSCGNCGKKDFSVYQAGSRDGTPKKVIVECQNCKSTTVIATRPAELELDWGENSDGILCVMG